MYHHHSQYCVCLWAIAVWRKWCPYLNVFSIHKAQIQMVFIKRAVTEKQNNCMFYKRALIVICSILWQIDLFLMITIIPPNHYNFACSNTVSITYFRMEKDAD